MPESTGIQVAKKRVSGGFTALTVAPITDNVSPLKSPILDLAKVFVDLRGVTPSRKQRTNPMSEGEAILYQLVEQIPESERGGNKDPMEIIDFAVERQLAKLRGARRRPAKRGMAGAKARKRARVH